MLLKNKRKTILKNILSYDFFLGYKIN